MPRRHSTLDDLITLPWWFKLILAATVYVFLKYWLPTIEFHSPAFKGLAATISNMAGIFASVLVFAAVMSALHSWRKGFHVEENTGSGPDGGIDLTLTKDGETYLVQCKNWRVPTGPQEEHERKTGGSGLVVR